MVRARGDRAGEPAPSSFEDRDGQDECRTRRSDLPVSCLPACGMRLSVVKNREWSSVFYQIRFCETNPFLGALSGDPETSTSTATGGGMLLSLLPAPRALWRR